VTELVIALVSKLEEAERGRFKCCCEFWAERLMDSKSLNDLFGAEIESQA